MYGNPDIAFIERRGTYTQVVFIRKATIISTAAAVVKSFEWDLECQNEWDETDINEYAKLFDVKPENVPRTTSAILILLLEKPHLRQWLETGIFKGHRGVSINRVVRYLCETDLATIGKISDSALGFEAWSP